MRLKKKKQLKTKHIEDLIAACTMMMETSNAADVGICPGCLLEFAGNAEYLKDDSDPEERDKWLIAYSVCLGYVLATGQYAI